MTQLVVNELITTLTQSVTFNHYRIHQVAGIKIKLLMFNAPAGTFTLSLKSGVTTLASSSFTSADIKTDLSTSDNYAWLYKALNIEIPLSPGAYDLELSASGYTPISSSFLGWVRSRENIFIEQSGTPDDFTQNPFDVLIYERMREDLIV